MLPYSAAVDSDPAEAVVSAPFPGLYQLSKAPEDRDELLDGAGRPYDTPGKSSILSARFGLQDRALWPPVGPALHEDLEVFFHPRCLLTCSSDRSPPLS